MLTNTQYWPIIPKKNYRFGFNGQEKDDEITGQTGSMYTAQFWEYDSRIGRRWNIDPVLKDWESPYACFSNNPIMNIDPNGADTVDNKGGSNTVLFNQSDNSPKYSGSESGLETANPVDKSINTAAFQAAYDQPLPKALISQYAYGEGNTIKLTNEGMAACNVSPLSISDFNGFADALGALKKPGDMTTFTGSYSNAMANTFGTLGQFTIRVSGVITLGESGWTFNGQMQYYDEWDFDNRASNNSARDIKTFIGRNFLYGKPFIVTTNWVDVNQNISDSQLDWFNGKSSKQVWSNIDPILNFYYNNEDDE